MEGPFYDPEEGERLPSDDTILRDPALNGVLESINEYNRNSWNEHFTMEEFLIAEGYDPEQVEIVLAYYENL